jgi:hypothetical protein
MPSPLAAPTPVPLGPRRAGAAAVIALSFLLTPSARAGVWQASGSLVDLSVEVEGSAAPLYPARDGSGRYYLEARSGSAYTVRVANRSSRRLGVLLAVDGLNAISGEREPGPTAAGRPGRMYVIDPWDEVRVRGWRTSLEDVRQFTFVDERASYATRSGRANGKMGWIEAWVYRERFGPRVSRGGTEPWDRGSRPEDQAEERPRRDIPPPDAAGTLPGAAPEGAAPPASAPPADADASRERAEGLRKAQPSEESYPGTGWGSRAWDPATVVSFVAEARPSDGVTIRYEYAPALRALGLIPPPWHRDRLAERERGEGFARPPAW